MHTDNFKDTEKDVGKVKEEKSREEKQQENKRKNTITHSFLHYWHINSLPSHLFHNVLLFLFFIFFKCGSPVLGTRNLFLNDGSKQSKWIPKSLNYWCVNFCLSVVENEPRLLIVSSTKDPGPTLFELYLSWKLLSCSLPENTIQAAKWRKRLNIPTHF